MPRLQLRNGWYHYRAVAPVPLRRVIGKSEVKEALLTRDANEAARRFGVADAKVRRIFDEARRALANGEGLERSTVIDEHLTTLAERGDLWAAKVLAQPVASENNPTLTTLWSRWAVAVAPRKQTAIEWDLACRRLVEVAGNVPVRSLTRQHVRDLKSSLLSTDKARATVQKNMSAVRAVLAWALRQGFVEVNVADGVSQVERKVREEAGRESFTDEEARLLLERATTDLSPQDRWLVWMGAYTGARLAELAGLRKEDVLPDRFIIKPHEGRGLKTRSSRREVPRHPQLDGLEWDGPAPSSAASKRMNRFIEKLLPGTTKVYHCFRHTFITKLRSAGVPAEVTKQIVGHASTDVHSRYGQGYPLAMLAEAVAKVRF